MGKIYKSYLIIGGLLAVILIGWGVYTVSYNIKLKNDIENTSVDTKTFKPYMLGDAIDFSETGNSSDFVKTSDGWGGQEPEHRCAVGNSTVMRLYIPDSVGSDLRLRLDAFGVYPPDTATYQEFTIFANDVKIGVLRVGHDGPFSIDIPNGIITDNTLTLRFVPAGTYSPPPDTRKLSMAVREIKIDGVLGAQTKRKIGKWIKENIMGGGVKQTYDTNISKEENWM